MTRTRRKATPPTRTFRFDGTHADTLDSGMTVAPGQRVKLTGDDLEQPAAARMLQDGLLTEQPDTTDDTTTED